MGINTVSVNYHRGLARFVNTLNPNKTGERSQYRLNTQSLDVVKPFITLFLVVSRMVICGSAQVFVFSHENTR